MRNSIPIKKIEGLELLDTGTAGVKSVAVNNTEAARDLSWDRYVRLQAASAVVRNLAEEPTTIVDAGGYDGALALFVPDHRVVTWRIKLQILANYFAIFRCHQEEALAEPLQ